MAKALRTKWIRRATTQGPSTSTPAPGSRGNWPQDKRERRAGQATREEQLSIDALAISRELEKLKYTLAEGYDEQLFVSGSACTEVANRTGNYEEIAKDLDEIFADVQSPPATVRVLQCRSKQVVAAMQRKLLRSRPLSRRQPG
ncbi:Hypothetical protein FKW44_001950 [Caligus rogercresseyi]|uniref:Uncharacterized protein n=1 Tax=Caligus rogercresseyi TaxID=217165 RepID=A0A7T8QW02_CALRO|nr:Hypothetical protein FKW44_001950 [Caligus rogercresseyi]